MAAEPIWRLPEVIVHNAAAQSMNGLPWHIADFKIDEFVWPRIKKRTEVVGIVDTGVGRKHLEQGELSGVVKDFADFTNSDYGPYDVQGHGTHVAGIIAAKSFGVARTAAELVCAKGLGDDGSGSDRDIGKALLWCVDKGASILNLSLGSSMPSTRINSVLKELAQQGVVSNVAAGNDGGAVNWPGRLAEVVSVSAIDRQRRLAKFSCYGPEIDLAAPGVEITSLGTGLGFAVMSGTSMATPWISGYVANLFAICRLLGKALPKTVAEMQSIFIGQTVDLGSQGVDSKFGWGLPDPSKFPDIPPPPVAAPTLPPPAVITDPGAGVPGQFVGLTVVDALGNRWAPATWARVA